METKIEIKKGDLFKLNKKKTYLLCIEGIPLQLCKEIRDIMKKKGFKDIIVMNKVPKILEFN